MYCLSTSIETAYWVSKESRFIALCPCLAPTPALSLSLHPFLNTPVSPCEPRVCTLCYLCVAHFNLLSWTRKVLRTHASYNDDDVDDASLPPSLPHWTSATPSAFGLVTFSMLLPAENIKNTSTLTSQSQSQSLRLLTVPSASGALFICLSGPPSLQADSAQWAQSPKVHP